MEYILSKKAGSPELIEKRCYGCGKVTLTSLCTCSLCGQSLLSVSQARQRMDNGVTNTIFSGPILKTQLSGKDGLQNETI